MLLQQLLHISNKALCLLIKEGFRDLRGVEFLEKRLDYGFFLEQLFVLLGLFFKTFFQLLLERLLLLVLLGHFLE